MRFQALKDIKSKYWVSAHQESQTSVTRSKASAELLYFFMFTCPWNDYFSAHCSVQWKPKQPSSLLLLLYTVWSVWVEKRPLVQIASTLPHPWKWKRRREISRNVIHHHHMTTTKSLWRLFYSFQMCHSGSQSMYIQIKQLGAKSVETL